MELVVATQNLHKLEEIQTKLKDIKILGINSSDFPEELSETGDTLAENASQKARQVYHILRKNCFADDTGLEIEALGGEPGVLSARYAGLGKNNQDNINLVLSKLLGERNRSARFRTVICLIFNNNEYFFEGVCEGEILQSPIGEKGFGYDAIFLPKGSTKSFAEMEMTEKGAISHRTSAIQKMVDFIKSEI